MAMARTPEAPVLAKQETSGARAWFGRYWLVGLILAVWVFLGGWYLLSQRSFLE